VRAVATAMDPQPRPSSDSRRSRWSGGSQYTGWAR
jgi:hypothetical protein